MNLSPRSVPVRVVENASRIVFFVAIGLVTGGGGTPPLSVLVGLVLLGGLAVAGWEAAYVARYSYETTADTLDIRAGVLSRRAREIPYERVQTVDVSQNFLHRLAGVAEVRIETAGGSDTEATLRYVSPEEARRLQETLSERTRREASAASGETLFELSTRELAVLGVVSADLRLLGLVSVFLSALAPTVARQLQPGPTLFSLAGPAIALVGIAGLWLLSAALSVFRYYQFRLYREGTDLRYERGLLQRFSGTIPTGKVQTLTVRENALARALGYAGLTIETAGYGPDRSGGAQSAVPLAKRDRALALARDLEPFGDLDLQRPPKRARTRYVARYALVVLALVALLGLVDTFVRHLGPWYLVAGLLVVVPVAAHLTWVHRGYHAGEEYVVTRRGFWRRRTVVVPYDRVQTVESNQSIFQRRRDLGSVVVDTASSGSFFGTEAVAVDLDAGAADRLREQTLDRFQRSVGG